MLSRLASVSAVSVIVLGCLLGLVRAAEEDKLRIGNETIDRTVQLRTHSIYAPYIDQDLQNRWWDFGADAYVNTNKHIRLTQNRPSQMGWLWSRLALTASNFVIELEFKVSGDSSHLFGDGLAVWLTKDRAQEGPVFGNKDNFEGLGIFLDTYQNGRHSYSFPRIYAMLGDGETSYDFGNDGDEQSIGGCSANFRRTNVATKLKITYVREKFLDVKIQYKAWDDWSDCFHLKNVSLPATPFLGFTAMTGDVSDAHDIITVTTYSAILAAQPDLGKKKKKGIFSGPLASSEEDSGTWFGFFFKLLLFAGVCAGGYYGYQEYQRRQAYVGGGNFGMGRGGGAGGGFGGGMYSGNKRAF
ncbi:putative legume-like lectin family protein [Lyophyllum shimeji]|uniref:Legume-like lectin family protein n=1 Tax=Lyophyllum shimeji TaxID=47721 RepID=A0A9P3PKZ9_LYOSH|nr:putative legume-like lectin family protein [Lyophyllum shimeji]